MSVPRITSITPKLGANDADQAVRINGSGFDSGVQVRVGNVTLSNIVRVDGNTITAEVPVDTPAGLYDLVVTNSDGNSDTLVGGWRSHFPFPDTDFTDENEIVIRERILRELEDNWDVSLGSFPYDMAAANAIEIARVYIRANEVLLNTYVQTARAGWLDLIGEQYGLLRDQAIKATGSVVVYGTNGVVIPEGSVFSTVVAIGQQQTAKTFVSTASATISGGAATVAVEAVNPGASGNVGIGQITRLVTQISGVSRVENTAATSGGSSKESDEDYRFRLLNFVQNPNGGGTKQDYIDWAEEVDNVGAVSCVPLGRGAGTVDIYVLDASMAVDAGVVSAVQDYIAPSPANEGGGKAPIGADVLVQSPSLININVEVTITAASGYTASAVQTSVATAITEYLTNLGIGEDVVYVHIANVVHDVTGVGNYSALTVNAGTADISIDVDEKAKANTITVNT